MGGHPRRSCPHNSLKTRIRYFLTSCEGPKRGLGTPWGDAVFRGAASVSRRIASVACGLGVLLLCSGASAQPLEVGGRHYPHFHSDVSAEGPNRFRALSSTLPPENAVRAAASRRMTVTADGQIVVELAPEDTTSANLFDLNGRTLVFTPDGRGGYSRDVRSLEWEESLGADVTLEWDRHRDGVEVEFGDFEFDYAGRRWSSVFVSRHGFLTFGAPLKRNPDPWFSPMAESAAWLAATPTISALYKPAFGGLYGRDPLAAQFVAHSPGRVAVTWFASEYDAYRLDVPDRAERFQAILHADGAIQFNYGRITVGDGVVGLFSDVVEKGDLIASVADGADPGLPGHLDLLEVGIWESTTGALIVEWTLRDDIPSPPSGTRYSYRLNLDADTPYFDGDFDDVEFMLSVDVTADGGWTRGGGRLPTGTANRIALLVDDAFLGFRGAARAETASYDEGGYVQGNWNTGIEPVMLLDPRRTDLSRSDPDPSGRQSEVFHHRGAPDVQSIACRVIENLGDRFDWFVWHNDFQVDAQMNDSDMRHYHLDVSGIGHENRHWRTAPCGDGRLLGHYAKVVRIAGAGGRSHEWRRGNFENDLRLFAHEFTHTWTAYLSYVRSSGVVDRLFADSFADSCRCHWRGTLHAPAAFPWGGEEAKSLMTVSSGGGFWRDNDDGTFTAIYDLGDASGLSWLDLYAMGLADPSEVRDLFVLHNLEPVHGNDNPRRNGGYWGTFYGDKESVSIDQIVAAMGPREPPAARSQKEFNTGFVYLVEPGQAPDLELLQLHKEYVDRVVEYWSHITGGRSRIAATILNKPGAGAEPEPAVLCTGATCLLQGERFRVKAWYSKGGSRSRPAGAVETALGASAGLFAADGAAPELLVRIVNGCRTSGWWEVHAGVASDADFNVAIRDTETGALKWFRPRGRSVVDAEAFACTDSDFWAVAGGPPAEPGATCTGATCLLQDGLFRMKSWYRGDGGSSRSAAAVPVDLGGSAGLFAFASGDPDLLVRVADTCDASGYWTVYAGTASDRGFSVAIRETGTNELKWFRSRRGRAIVDAEAFVCANRGPRATGAIPARTVMVGRTVAVAVDAYFSDPDGDALTYAAESSNAEVAGVRVEGSVVSVTALASGAAAVTVTASDPGGLSARQAFDVRARAEAAPTILSVEPSVLVEGETAMVSGWGFSARPRRTT